MRWPPRWTSRVFVSGRRSSSYSARRASACLPLLHHAIELDGEPYWDGGYAANPPLIPLVHASETSHILIVQVTPNMSNRLPKTTSEIAARIEQIQFNATLNTELEALKYGKII